MKKAFRYNEILLLKNLTISKERVWYKNIMLGIGRLVSSFWTRDRLIDKLNSFGVHKKDDSLLRKLYGDYMKLPPIEEQTSHHAFNAWYN